MSITIIKVSNKIDVNWDMDDTSFDWTGHLNKRLEQEFPDLKTIPRTEQKDWWCHKNYPEEYHKRINDIWREPEFYANLEPMPGAQAAFWWLLKNKFEVHFVTTPVPGANRGLCMKEKYDSLVKHFNEKAAQWLIPAYDKTMVIGDFLIDDRPDIKGRYQLIPQHLLFDQNHQYNINHPDAKDKPKINWDNFPEKFMAHVERYYRAKK